jgi:hypothetical protein
MASTFVFEQLPIDVVGNIGSEVSLSSLLTAALGPNSGGYPWYQIVYYNASYLAANDLSYWNLNDEVASSFSVNGQEISGSTTSYFNNWTDITQAQLSSTTINIEDDNAESLCDCSCFDRRRHADLCSVRNQRSRSQSSKCDRHEWSEPPAAWRRRSHGRD